METSNFYSRSKRGDIEDLENSFKPGKYFVERKSDNKWLVPFCHPNTLNEEHWTNNPNNAMAWRTKPLAELEIIRMKLGDSALVTEHEFVEPESTPVIEQKEEYTIHEEVLKDDVAMFADKESLLIYDHFFRKGVESKQLTPNDGWISVKERLPETLINVSVFFDDGISGFVSRGYYTSSEWIVMKWSGQKIGAKVTHWMPLPKPPQQ